MLTAVLPVLEGSCPQPMSITERRKRPNVGAPEALTAVRSDESEVPMATCVYLKNTFRGEKKSTWWL